MKLSKVLKQIFKITLTTLFVLSSKNSMIVNAAWNNNAVDYVNTYGETLRYLNGAFWFAQYGTAGGTSSTRYAIIGFNTSTTFNGSTYSFSSKVGSGGSFQVVDERQSGSYVYTLWKLDYNTMITRLKGTYPSVDFSALSSQSVSSTYKFNAIMSIKRPGYTTPAGSIDNTGKVLTSPVYTTVDGILGAATWYGSAPDEIRRLFNISCTVSASVKPTPITPNLTHFRIENANYKDPNSETYWVKPTTTIRVVTEAGIPIANGVYPERLLVRVYKGTTANYRTFYQDLKTKLFSYWSEGSPGNVTGDAANSSVNSYASSVYNYMAAAFSLKFPDNGATHRFQYTSTYNGQYKPYLETNKYVKVDGTAPSISGASNFGWSNANCNINISASDSGSGVASIKLYRNGTLVSSTTGTNLSYNNTSEGISTFKVEATDKVGNMSTASFTHYIDKTVPKTTISTTPNVWKNSNISASITASDSASGVKTIQYKLTGATNQDWTTYTGPITISNNGSTTISSRAYDNAGNLSSKSTATVYVDKAVPSVAMTATSNTWLKGSTSVNMTASDSHSGVNRIEYRMTGATSVGWTKYSGAVTVSNNGKTTVYARSYDNAGNVSSEISKEIWIDTGVPTVAITTTRTTWKNTAISVSLSASDSMSGVSRIEYKLSGAKVQDWTTYSGAFSIATNGKTTIQARSIDLAGNVSSVASAEVWFDNVAPTASFSTASATVTRTISINVSSLADANSGVSYILVSNTSDFTSSTKYSVAGKVSDTLSFTLDKKSTVDANYTQRTVYLRVYDNANNYKSYTVSTKLNPAKPAAPTVNLPTNDNPVYVDGESVYIDWTHNNGVNDFILPQTSAKLVVTNTDTKKSETINITGNTSEYKLSNLDYGQYSVSITTNNFGPHVSDTKTVTFRYNKFKSSGLVRTIKINPSRPIKYVGISTKTEIPKGCSIEGKLYYSVKTDGSIDYSVYKPFKITENYKENIIKLTKTTTALQIDLVLKNTTSPNDPYVTPFLDDITVFAR